MAQGSFAVFSMLHCRSCSVNKPISGTFVTKITIKIHQVSFLFQKYQPLSSHLLCYGGTISEKLYPIQNCSYLALSQLYYVIYGFWQKVWGKTCSCWELVIVRQSNFTYFFNTYVYLAQLHKIQLFSVRGKWNNFPYFLDISFGPESRNF